MKISKTHLSILILTSALLISNNSFAQNCDNYPYQPMENTIEFDGDGNFKLISTASVTINFDDSSELKSARREAELIAKRFIAEYITQNLSTEDKINSEISKSKSNAKATDGSTVSSVQRDEIKKQLTTITSKSETVLKGVVSIGSCYTKGEEVRVTVGVKSQTLNNATQLGKSLNGNKPSNKSYDGSKKLNDF